MIRCAVCYVPYDFAETQSRKVHSSSNEGAMFLLVVFFCFWYQYNKNEPLTNPTVSNANNIMIGLLYMYFSDLLRRILTLDCGFKFLRIHRKTNRSKLLRIDILVYTSFLF